jgi:ABC-2 type transport system ATP-binding protein
LRKLRRRAVRLAAEGFMSGLAVSHLSYAYGSKQALHDLSFRVAPGDFCALLGPNGAGKTTLFALLTRLFLPGEGQIEIAGIDLAKHPRKALARMGVVFQQPTLDLDLTVWRNLSYYAALHGLSGRAAAKRIDAALERLGMRERAREKARNLNGGHRRRMEIARALIHGPSVLLLDEPTVGLDVAARMSITAHVHALCRDERLTALWATHLVDEVAPDDALIVLHHGRIVAQGRMDEISGDERLADRFASLTQEAAL